MVGTLPTQGGHARNARNKVGRRSGLPKVVAWLALLGCGTTYYGVSTFFSEGTCHN